MTQDGESRLYGRWHEPDKECADFVSLLKFKSRPFKAKFVPNKIFSDLDSRKNDLWALRMYLRKFRIRVESVEYEEITIGGEFDEDEFIILRILGDYENHVFNDDEWYMFKFRLVQTICHEFIHWSQYDQRGHTKSNVLKYVSKHPEAAYYSVVDEICAYAHCIFVEIDREHPGIPISEAIEHYCGETYDIIFNEVFENDFNNLALERYAKEILRWEKTYKQR